MEEEPAQSAPTGSEETGFERETVNNGQFPEAVFNDASTKTYPLKLPSPETFAQNSNGKGQIGQIGQFSEPHKTREEKEVVHQNSVDTFLLSLLSAGPMEWEILKEQAEQAGYDREETRRALSRMCAEGKLTASIGPPRNGLCDLEYRGIASDAGQNDRK